MASEFEQHLARQRAWSFRTFGPGGNTLGVLDHIMKEVGEVLQAPDDLYEWVDIMILACDGALRQGYTPDEIWTALQNKQEINENRQWPDWRTAEPGRAIEHVR